MAVVDDSNALAEAEDIPFKVKNTFIDVDAKLIEFIEDATDADAAMFNLLPKRQVSEPPLSLLRQRSQQQQELGAMALAQRKALEAQRKANEVQEVQEESDEDSVSEDGKVQYEAWQRISTADTWDRAISIPNIASMAAGVANGNFGADGECAAPAYFCAVPVLGIPMGHGADAVGPNGMVIPPMEWGETCSVSMNFLPLKYTQEMLLQELEHTGFQGTFHSCHVPVDAGGNSLGYAIIDFVSPGHAWMFKMAYEGRRMNHSENDEVIVITPAPNSETASNGSGAGASVARQANAQPMPHAPGADKVPGVGKKPRRRRGGGSLIDLAKQRAAAMTQEGLKAGVPDVDLIAQQRLAATARQQGATPGTPAAPAVSFCPYCGGKAQASFKFCSFCGASLSLP
mmetsp:Transcript_28027/g.84497  ORF Transcript_28027/g.84497 Transcript_28027/m.84497 type:complete len:400 (-) Transcript_28027:241-1440(-)